ncbi:MAG: acyl-CoA thioesterase [Clostridia bacterium]|nr:acyl-CoA thioesterase [Clostridia bacterium]
MHEYIHKVCYHETDKMGITHHSNYIRWMEEARVDFLDHIGYGYARMEQDGIISPVIGVECQYKQPTTFSDEVRIQLEVEEFRGVRLVIRYTMFNHRTGALVLTGKTRHCFTNVQGRPIQLKKQFPELDALLKSLVAPASDEN